MTLIGSHNIFVVRKNKEKEIDRIQKMSGDYDHNIILL